MNCKFNEGLSGNLTNRRELCEINFRSSGIIPSFFRGLASSRKYL